MHYSNSHRVAGVSGEVSYTRVPAWVDAPEQLFPDVALGTSKVAVWKQPVFPRIVSPNALSFRQCHKTLPRNLVALDILQPVYSVYLLMWLLQRQSACW